jgi:hypothetical protein
MYGDWDLHGETALLERFKLSQLTLEFRFPDSFLIWDFSGRLWTDMKAIFPALVMTDANPNRVMFQAADRWNLEVSINVARLTDTKPTSTYDKETETIEKFVEIFVRHLKVATISRLGILLVYNWVMRSEAELNEQAGNIFFRGKKLDKHFGVEPSKKCLPTVHLNVEDEDLGYWFKIQPEVRTAELKTPPGESLLKNQTSNEYRVNLSIDHYTVKSIDMEQLRIADILKRIRHVTNRDGDKLLSEIGLS